MRELSLFTGAGGGLLGTMLLGWEPIGYVENNEYCQKVIAARIRDGYLPEAPIFGDIKAFNRDGYAEAYQGMVDVVTGGFPCQPFSVAGKRTAEKDDRNMWPETRAVIQIVRPPLVFLENVPGLLAHEYAVTILRQLAEDGYAALPPIKLGADDVGANHRRKRIWIVAYTASPRLQTARKPGTQQGIYVNSGGQDVPHAIRPECKPGARGRGVRQGNADVADAEHVNGRCGTQERQKRGTDVSLESIARQWATEPDVGRVAHGVASRVDRLKALGNGQVPAVAATAWRLLNDE